MRWLDDRRKPRSASSRSRSFQAARRRPDSTRSAPAPSECPASPAVQPHGGLPRQDRWLPPDRDRAAGPPARSARRLNDPLHTGTPARPVAASPTPLVMVVEFANADYLPDLSGPTGNSKIFRRGIQGICFFIVEASGINGGTLNGPCCVGDLLPAHADTLRFQQASSRASVPTARVVHVEIGLQVQSVRLHDGRRRGDNQEAAALSDPIDMPVAVHDRRRGRRRRTAAGVRTNCH